MPRPLLNIVWFKRDLRLADHASLHAAARAGLPTLLVFGMEPQLMQAPDADLRHWRFAWQACADLQPRLQAWGHHLWVCHREMEEIVELLHRHFTLHTLFSHRETGHKASFDRDRRLATQLRHLGVEWQEFSQDGVQRGLRHRHGWTQALEAFLEAPQVHPPLDQLIAAQLPAELAAGLPGPPVPTALTQPNPAFQPGGETYARRYWESFLAGRGAHYGRHISKPQLSRHSCSRLSPYLAWGCVGVRQLWQDCARLADSHPLGRSLAQLRERLWWRSHCIQKLESEWQMEFEPLNRAFAQLDHQPPPHHFAAWAEGRTGYPMVDASMRCLQATGWINFRMRAMLVTFATFTLGLPWREVALHLARLFLDYEPGIHYAQIQMQAGLTGYHTLRVYNPTTQAERHDPTGVFIQTWLPALGGAPPVQRGQPWLLTPLEQQLYGCVQGHDYPHRLVDFAEATARHRNRYWALRHTPAAQALLPAVLARHCTPMAIARYRDTSGG